MEKKYLMVSPEYFDVLYSINPWMNTNVKVDKAKALKQWKCVYKTLVDKAGKENVFLLAGKKNLLDMVFSANAGMVFDNKFISSRFRDIQRIGEEKYYLKFFKKEGYSTYHLSEKAVWEGQACMIKLNNEIICSYSQGGRANKQAYKEMKEILKNGHGRFKYIELIDPYFYHLDVCLCVLNKDLALACPLAFKEKDYLWLKTKIKKIIDVSYDDALNFGCNALFVLDELFISKQISNKLVAKLDANGIKYKRFDVSEFIKSGGGVKCMIFEYE